MNAGRTPQGIGLRQSANQRTNLRTDGRPPCSTCLNAAPSSVGIVRAASAPPCRDERCTRPVATPSTPRTTRSKTTDRARSGAEASACVCKRKAAGEGRGSPGRPLDDLFRRAKPVEINLEGSRAWYPILLTMSLQSQCTLGDLVLANHTPQIQH